MLPLPLLIALVLAFGVESTRDGVPAPDVGFRVLETCGGVSIVALLSLGLGLWVASQVSRGELPITRVRGRHARGMRVLTVLSLLIYGWIIHSVGWGRLVRGNWGLDGWGILGDLVVFSPFVAIQVVGWCGQYLAERALQVRIVRIPHARLARYLVLKGRQTLGLIMPVILLFVVRRDVIERVWPGWEENALASPIEIVLLGSLILFAAPLFIRFAWPTRRLPEGPLRSRLERVAARAGFRFTDVLIWDTGNSVLNACVTGILPGFRYVLLTDSLVETMTPLEIAAVFGHEIGHIAHRHLLFFGFFFAGSLGIVTLVAEGVVRAAQAVPELSWLPQTTWSSARELVQEGAVLAFAGLYFWLIFGHLSRRFERQADVFGSKLVSCDQADCPPHADTDLVSTGQARSPRLPLCRQGLRTFADALSIVAQCNGMELKRPSWRHGSIASRIGFLEQLERDLDSEPRFQREVAWLQGVLGVILLAALAAATLLQMGQQ